MTKQKSLSTKTGVGKEQNKLPVENLNLIHFSKDFVTGGPDLHNSTVELLIFSEKLLTL